MKCTNCGVESTTHYCATCEPIRERLEALRLKQREDRRRIKPPRFKAKPRVGGWFSSQVNRYLEQQEEQRRENDNALPPSDRQELGDGR